MADRLLEELFAYEAGWEKAVVSADGKGIKRGVVENFSAPSFRQAVKDRIAAGRYSVRPPHEARIPKDDGTMRTVYANEADDRVLLTAVNDTLFRLCPDMVHPACKSYQAGIGCGRIARQVSRDLAEITSGGRIRDTIGYKIDLSKYFDSVPIAYVDAAFDGVEQRLGPSAVLDMLREYYHDDVLLDIDRKPIRKYTSLRQGCAVAAFLADSVLYHIDEALSAMDVAYYRYSDDILILGKDADAAFAKASGMLSDMGLALNPKKVERLHPEKWFTFLGFSLYPSPGGLISLSKKRVGNFQHAVEKRTFGHPAAANGPEAAMRRLARYLYVPGPSGYGYAEGLLPIITSGADIRQMDLFVLDCLRACATGKDRVGGLGWDGSGKSGVIRRGRGRNVTSNRTKLPRIDGYVPLSHMQSAFMSSRRAYAAYARSMGLGVNAG